MPLGNVQEVGSLLAPVPTDIALNKSAGDIGASLWTCKGVVVESVVLESIMFDQIEGANLDGVVLDTVLFDRLEGMQSWRA